MLVLSGFGSFPRHVLQLNPCIAAAEQRSEVVWRTHPDHICAHPCGAYSIQAALDTGHLLRWGGSHQGRAAELETKDGLLPYFIGSTMAMWYSGSMLKLLSRVHQAVCAHMFSPTRSHRAGRSYKHPHAPPCSDCSSRAAIYFLLDKPCPSPIALSRTSEKLILRGTWWVMVFHPHHQAILSDMQRTNISRDALHTSLQTIPPAAKVIDPFSFPMWCAASLHDTLFKCSVSCGPKSRW